MSACEEHGTQDASKELERTQHALNYLAWVIARDSVPGNKPVAKKRETRAKYWTQRAFAVADRQVAGEQTE